MERRMFLQAIGTGSTTIGFVGVSSADDGSDKNIKQPVDINAFKKEDQYKKLVKYLKKLGWEPRESTTVAERVITGQGRYDYAVVDFKSQNRGKDNEKDEEVVVIWVGNDSVGLDLPYNFIAYNLRKTVENERTGSKSTFFGYDKVTTYVVDEGVVEEVDHDDSLKESTSNSPELRLQSSEYCEIDVCLPPESNWSWGCVAKLILGGIGTALGCAGCIIDPTKLSCSSCIISAGLTGDQLVQCTGGWDACDVQTVEIEKEWLNNFDDSGYAEDNNCSYYSSDNDRVLPLPQDYFDEEVPTR